MKAATACQPASDSPIALILHPHPQFGGTMNNRVVYNLHYAFHRMGFTVLRFNFRGVGRSQGEFDQGVGELSDAALALDYLQAMNPNSKHCWVAGFSFGAWIGMQLLMQPIQIIQGRALIAADQAQLAVAAARYALRRVQQGLYFLLHLIRQLAPAGGKKFNAIIIIGIMRGGDHHAGRRVQLPGEHRHARRGQYAQ